MHMHHTAWTHIFVVWGQHADARRCQSVKEAVLLSAFAPDAQMYMYQTTDTTVICL